VIDYILKEKFPVLTNEDINACKQVISEYGKDTFTIGSSIVIYDQYYDLTITDTKGYKQAIRIIHPLSKRLSTTEQIRIERNKQIKPHWFTYFEIQRNPFHILNMLVSTND
jgi:hypothetical protein